jgi:hypothetical protein
LKSWPNAALQPLWVQENKYAHLYRKAAWCKVSVPIVRPDIVFKRPTLQGLVLKGEYPKTREGVGGSI